MVFENEFQVIYNVRYEFLVEHEKDIFERMQIGGIIKHDDPQFEKIFEQIGKTKALSVQLNNASDAVEIREVLSKI